jgi:hypothetical protein
LNISNTLEKKKIKVRNIVEEELKKLNNSLQRPNQLKRKLLRE